MFLLSSFLLTLVTSATVTTKMGGTYVMSGDHNEGVLTQPVGDSFGWCAIGHNDTPEMNGAKVNVFKTSDASFISSHTLGNHNKGTPITAAAVGITAKKDGDNIKLTVNIKGKTGHIIFACGTGEQMNYHGKGNSGHVQAHPSAGGDGHADHKGHDHGTSSRYSINAGLVMIYFLFNL